MTFVSYAQNFEDVLLWRALKDVKDGFYIDVGAWEPDLHSVTRAFSDRGWRGINIEPVALYHEMLVQRRPRDINIRALVGASSGATAFYEIAGTGLSTMDADLAASHAARGYGVMQTETEILTLAEICRRHAPGAIHFLKVDCEGGERDALAGADFARFRPWIVLAEATVPNSSEASHAEWEDLLLQGGYRFAWFDGLNRFYVAAEYFERLAPLLALPPNVFDEFVLAALQAPASAAVPAPPADPLCARTPESLPVDERIALAQRCRDCDDLPKVPGAGTIQTEPDGTAVQIMHNGLKVLKDGYCGPWMTRLISLCQGHHEPQEERLFHAVNAALPHDATMIELGGNWCYYTAWFLHGAPERRAVVLEPDPANRSVGERNLQLNQLSAKFMAGIAGERRDTLAPFQTERSGIAMLRSFSVPQIMAMHDIDMLDMLHCDTQGAELGVLSACAAFLRAGRIRWLFVSTHVHHISRDPLTHRRCLKLLRDCGAVIEAEHDAHESFSGDGLIVARFGAAPRGWQPVRISIARHSESLFRDLAYDLAEALPLVSARETLASNLVQQAFASLLLRGIDLASLAFQTETLLRTGDTNPLLSGILHSPEFKARRREFEAAYFGAADQGKTLPALPPDGPFHCAALQLVLDRATPLGEAGDTLVVPNDQLMLPSILARGQWSPEHLAFLKERADPEQRYLLLDIGANIGLFSRQVLRAMPNIGSCHCCEPDPGNYAALCSNLSQWSGNVVHTYNVGLGEIDGEASFFRDGENFGNYSIHSDAMRDRPFTETTVRMRQASEWLETAAVGEAPILWKSDTQGNDELVVAAASWPIWHRVQAAIVELWRIRKPGPTPADFIERVADMPNRRIGIREVSTDDVAAYLGSDDWTHDDLFLWR